jgi:CRP-like cAMP-binding protein
MQTIVEYCASANAPVRNAGPSEVLLEEGLSSGRLYVLIAGTIEVKRGDTTIVVTSTPGAIFGEMSGLLGRPHSATVRAVTPSTLYELHDSAAFLRGHPEVAYSVARLLAQRLHAATTYLVDLKHQFQAQEDHFGMVDEILDSLIHHQTDFVAGSDRAPDPPK